MGGYRKKNRFDLKIEELEQRRKKFDAIRIHDEDARWQHYLIVRTQDEINNINNGAVIENIIERLTVSTLIEDKGQDYARIIDEIMVILTEGEKESALLTIKRTQERYKTDENYYKNNPLT